MPAGFQVFGSHGIAQIDENYKNFVVVSQGSKATGDWTTSGLVVFTQIVVTNAVAPLVAFRAGQQVGLAYTAISGSTWTFTFFSASATAMNYWVFDESPASSPTNVGIEIYNAAGQRVYHSAQKPFRVVGAGGGTYTSGRTYAAVQASPGFNYTTVPSGLPFPEEWYYSSYIDSVAISSNVVTLGDVGTDSAYIINDAGSYAVTAGPTLVVDVTHF